MGQGQRNRLAEETPVADEHCGNRAQISAVRDFITEYRGNWRPKAYSVNATMPSALATHQALTPGVPVLRSDSSTSSRMKQSTAPDSLMNKVLSIGFSYGHADKKLHSGYYTNG